MRRPTLPLLFLLAACAQAAPDPLPDPIGLTESQLIERLGVPLGTHEVEGRRFLTYESRSRARTVTPSIGLGFGSFGGGWGSGTAIGTGLGLSFGGGGGSRSCLTTYELRAGTVIGVTRQGPGCA